MARFHVNPVTGNAGQCKAFYDCPFGDQETGHYDTVDEARAAFESTQDTLPSPKKKRDRVYRVGSLEAPTKHFDDLAQVVKLFDEFVPEGRQGRAGAIFASPDLDSHMRWVKGSNLTRGDTTSHEITVDPNAVYVYPIEVYERASHSEQREQVEQFEELRKEYWETGMTLTDWRAWAAKAKPKPGTWELLLPPQAIQQAKPMSNRRVIEAAPENVANEINWALEPRRAAKGLIWRKPKLEDNES